MPTLLSSFHEFVNLTNLGTDRLLSNRKSNDKPLLSVAPPDNPKSTPPEIIELKRSAPLNKFLFS